ncbi:MAG: hypothetical protein IPK19_25395 [Chloroflexi bacterium]|nr:hypothetical protein [Chloroflexota bacterium]
MDCRPTSTLANFQIRRLPAHDRSRAIRQLLTERIRVDAEAETLFLCAVGDNTTVSIVNAGFDTGLGGAQRFHGGGQRIGVERVEGVCLRRRQSRQ